MSIKAAVFIIMCNYVFNLWNTLPVEAGHAMAAADRTGRGNIAGAPQALQNFIVFMDLPPEVSEYIWQHRH